jgi:hypothetical protein
VFNPALLAYFTQGAKIDDWKAFGRVRVCLEFAVDSERRWRRLKMNGQ